MKDHPIKGVAIMTFAIFLATITNMFAKLLSDVHSPMEIVFWRNLFAWILIVCIILQSGNYSLFKTDRLKGQLIRGIGGTIGLLFVFWAYSLMPMADVVAIMFTGGLMTTAVSAIWLKEKVGVYRWGAVVIGFIGAVITAAPSGDDWQLKSVIIALTAAFMGGAVVSTMLRSLGKTEPALTTVFYLLSIGIIMMFPYVAWQGTLPTSGTIWPIIACGICGGLSLITKTQAFRYAEASLLSPVYYTSLIWALILGWLVWDDFPTANVLIGAGVIIGANIVILIREQQKSKPISSTDSDLQV